MTAGGRMQSVASEDRRYFRLRPVVDSHDPQLTVTTERRGYECSSVCVTTLKYLGVNQRPIATFPLEHDEEGTAVCHIDHLRGHRIRAVCSAVGAHPKALQRRDG